MKFLIKIKPCEFVSATTCKNLYPLSTQRHLHRINRASEKVDTPVTNCHPITISEEIVIKTTMRSSGRLECPSRSSSYTLSPYCSAFVAYMPTADFSIQPEM